MNNLNLNLIGPQGSGKGTQAALLSEKLGLMNVMTSKTVMDNLHLLSKEDQAKFKKIFDEGSLWPGDLVAEVLYKKIAEIWEEGLGIVLDGYPRTVEQIGFFEEKLKEGGKDWSIFRFVYLQIGRKESVKRILGRRVCTRCKYPVPAFDEYKEEVKCRKCGGELTKRADDEDRKAVERRLDTFYQDTKPILKYFSDKGLVHVINGEQSIEDVNKDITKALGV